MTLALASHAPWAQVQLPALGESASDDLAVADERRLGEQIMRMVWRDPAYLDDPVLLEYVQSLWAPLVVSARRLGYLGADIDAMFALQAFLVRDPAVNAFALPGGHVGVYLGLLAVTASRDELASVLAHELTHVSQRHIARNIGNSQRTGMVGVAAMLLGLLVATRSGNTDAAAAAIAGGQAALIQDQLNFSRDAEREADRIGWVIFNDAGYASAGMAAMFERLEQANRLNDGGAFPYLRSHPLTGDRIAEARARVLAAGPGPAAQAEDDALHLMMSARARVLMDPSLPALQRALVDPVAGASPARRLAAAYGRALASSLLGNHEAALAGARAAQASAGDMAPAVQRQLRLLEAELRLRADMPGAALPLLDATTSGRGPRPELLLQAQSAWTLARLEAGAAAAPLRTAVEALQSWTAEHADDALAWTRLGQVSAAAGLPLRAARAEAEARAAQGDLSGAIDRLRTAQRATAPLTPGTPAFTEAQVIDARLRVWTAQLRAELQRDGRRRQ